MGCGARVAQWIPNPKVACSNQVILIYVYHIIFFMSKRFFIRVISKKISNNIISIVEIKIYAIRTIILSVTDSSQMYITAGQ